MGRRQAIKIDSWFHGYGQITIALMEKKIMNIVDMQYARNATVAHLSQRELLVSSLELIKYFFQNP